MLSLLPPATADAAFYAVFGVFLAGFAVLCVVSIRWAVRHDRPGRAEWLRRQERRGGGMGLGGLPPPRPNGHVPHGPGPRGRQGKRRR